MGQEDNFLYFLGILFVFCAILFLAWLTTRLVGKKVSGDRRTKRMTIVESLPLGVDRSLLLVRVGDRHYLLATSRARTDFMSEVDPGPEPDGDHSSQGNDFRSLLERYSGMGRQTGKAEDIKQKEAEDSGIQTGIRKLRKINGTDRS